jgi:hypothetical protein
MKNLTQTFTKLTLLSLFLALFSFASFAQKGSGEVIKKTFKVDSFDGIKIGGAFNVYLRQGDVQDVTLVTDDNIMDNLKVTVSGGVLKIKSDYDMNNPTELKAFITVKDLNSLELSGACEVEGKNTIVSKNLSLKVSGASDVEIAVRCSALKIFASGASDLKLSGDASLLEIDASGACTIKAEKLAANQATIESSGASTVKVDVTEALDAKASGASSILYRGSAKVTANESGASDIKKM